MSIKVRHGRWIILHVSLVAFLVYYTGVRAIGPSLVNGDFETGGLSGWTVFTSANGTLGGEGFPSVLNCDTKGNGAVTRCARFKVGQRLYKGPGAKAEGGGFYQTVSLGEGQVTVTAEIAASYSSERHLRNLSGGSFELLLDNKVVDSHDFGSISAGATERSTLSGTASILAGMHEIRVRITRQGVIKAGTPTPTQFVDNIALTFVPAR